MLRVSGAARCMIAVDTNILFDAHDARDGRKQKIAVELIASLQQGVLLWQVACEYLWASRKLEPQGFSYADALADVRGLQRAWRTVLPAWEVLDRIERLKSKQGFSHWDALLLGTCLRAGSGLWSPRILKSAVASRPCKSLIPFHGRVFSHRGCDGVLQIQT